MFKLYQSGLAVFLHMLLTWSFTCSQECFQQGECTSSLYVDAWVSSDYQECLDNCRSLTECQFFTYFETDGLCDGFANCPEFDQSSCVDCYSGLRECPDVQCEIIGQCSGAFITSAISNSYDDCLLFCQEDNSCQWMTYDSSDGTCTLLGTCDTTDSCTTCVSSQRFCSATATTTPPTTTPSVANLLGDLTKIIAIGGYIGRQINTVEVVDLLNPNSQCGLLAPLPTAIRDNAATLVQGVLKNCGGGLEADIADNSTSPLCFDYNPGSDSWSRGVDLPKPREDAASSVIDSNWLITGGVFQSDSAGYTEYNDSTLWYGTGFQPSITLPYPMNEHCQVTLNSTHIFLADSDESHAYIVDFFNDNFIQMPDFFGERVVDTACGLIQNSVNGPEVVVAGNGYSEIFNLGTLTWRPGPELIPYGEDYGYAQLDTTFVIAGGVNQGVESSEVILFDNENYEWIFLEQKLQVAREEFALVAVPGDFINC